MSMYLVTLEPDWDSVKIVVEANSEDDAEERAYEIVEAPMWVTVATVKVAEGELS